MSLPRMYSIHPRQAHENNSTGCSKKKTKHPKSSQRHFIFFDRSPETKHKTQREHKAVQITGADQVGSKKTKTVIEMLPPIINKSRLCTCDLIGFQ